MVKMDEMYRLWEKGWPGHSREEMNAIIDPFCYPLISQVYTQAFKKKKPYTNRLLYKFCGDPSEKGGYALNNFEKNILYLASASQLNDPSEACFAFDIERFLVKFYGYSHRCDPQRIFPGLFQMAFGSFGSSITPEMIPILKKIFQNLPNTFITADPILQAANEIKAAMAEDGNETLFYHFLTRKLTFDDFVAFSFLIVDDPRLSSWAKTFGIPETMDEGHTLDAIFTRFETLPFSEGDTRSALIMAGQLIHYPKMEKMIEAYDSFAALRETTLAKWNKEVASTIGIASLTEDYDNPLMWAHYAKDSQGFCLEYDLTNPLSGNENDIAYARGHLIPVRYSDEKPLLFPEEGLVPQMRLKNLLAFFSSKSSGWAYEHEWRVIGNMDEHPRELIIRPKAVLVGLKASEETKKILLMAAQNKKLPVYSTEMDPQNYHIHRGAQYILQ
jgi:hypothetical protein